VQGFPCKGARGVQLRHIVPTEILTEYKPLVSCRTSANKGNPDKAGASRAGGAARARSKFSLGIAKAMAEQWGGICVDQQ
jgi:hypothetical protein